MKKKLLNNNFVRLLLVLLVLAACAGLGAGIAIYEDRLDPTNFVARYYGKFLTQKYEEMLDFADVDDAFIPKGKFSELMKKFRKDNNIGDYELSKPSTDENGNYFVRVVFENVATGQKGNWDIHLAQKKNLITNAFTEWKIDLSQYMVHNFRVKVPSNMRLAIDGVDIDESYAKVSIEENANVIIKENGETMKLEPHGSKEENREGKYVIYTFPTIIKGNHSIKAFGSYTNIEGSIELNNDNQIYELKLEDRVISGSYKDRVQGLTDEFIKLYYDDVKDRKNGSKTLMSYLKSDKELKSNFKKMLNADIEAVFWPEINNIDEYYLKERKFGDIDTTIKYKDKGKFLVECKYSFDYVSSTKTELFDSYTQSISGKCTVKLNMTFSVVGDKLKISEIKMKRKNEKN